MYVAGRLVEDDLNILVEGSNGEYVLKAVVSAFPAGFRIQDKMDKPLSAIHKPVPMYKEKLAFSMDRYVLSSSEGKWKLTAVDISAIPKPISLLCD